MCLLELPEITFWNCADGKTKFTITKVGDTFIFHGSHKDDTTTTDNVGWTRDVSSEIFEVFWRDTSESGKTNFAKSQVQCSRLRIVDANRIEPVNKNSGFPNYGNLNR